MLISEGTEILLISFERNDRDQLALRLINTQEFQRLRRIKQLGLSEFVFPGATHTRFAHSIGVFNNARRLVDLVERQTGKKDPQRALETCLTALLHDLGHGPFSHTFEKAQKKIHRQKKHEEWSADIISNPEGEISKILGPVLATSIASRLKKKDPSDIFDSIVASQFDADRLDYLRRDRHATGVEIGGVDFEWLLDALRVGEITVSHENDEIYTVPGLYLSEKGLRAAEGYLLARFHLYEQVYLHKATRCMESMLEQLLVSASKEVKAGSQSCLFLTKDSALTPFLAGQELSTAQYCALDDFTLWASITAWCSSTNTSIAEMARRLANRRLYKCVDIGRLQQRGSSEHALMRFKKAIREYQIANPDHILLEDTVALSPYTLHGYDEPGALQKVLIGKDEGGDKDPQDVASRSTIVGSLERVTIFRMYVEDEEKKCNLLAIWEREKNA